MPLTPPVNDRKRPISVPRPASCPQAVTPGPKQSAGPQSRPVSKLPKPPPAPNRTLAKRSKALPPPLPEDVLLTDADLIDDEDVTRIVRPSQPTAVDVELDCFSRTEPPPESGPRRKPALIACVTGLLLVATTGVLFFAHPVAFHALQIWDAAGSAAARTPASLTVAAISNPAAQASLAARPSAAPSGAPSAELRPTLSAHSKRSKAAINVKKPAKRVPPNQHAQR